MFRYRQAISWNFPAERLFRGHTEGLSLPIETWIGELCEGV